jgi:hypothetical protein
MDNNLMSQEKLEHLGYGEEQVVQGAKEYDKAKEKAGYTAGKHISTQETWWFQRWFS